MDVQKLMDDMYPQIAQHEGIRNKVYKDTKNKNTIGIGFNLDDPTNRRIAESIGIDVDKVIRDKTPISNDQIDQLYKKSFANAYADAKTWLPDLHSHPLPVQKAVIDMAYNLGRSSLFTFERARKAFNQKDYDTAADEMLDSKWRTQVKGRAYTLADMVRKQATK